MATKIKSTKQLAWELGFLRKRTSSVSIPNESKKHKLDIQHFSHLVVLDFESTCWENEKSIPQEIIEFPAVLVNCHSGEIESEFRYFIQPSENPYLSDFCQQLTGISQELVDNGISLSVCLRKFLSWLKKLEREKGIVCASDKNLSKCKNVQPEQSMKLAAFVTWSDWDLGVCLLYEAKRKQIMKPSVLDRWIDLRATYRKFYSRRPDGLSGALNDLGINFDGRQHSGLDDAKNTAKLAYRMICDGCILDNTKTLKAGPCMSSERLSIPAPVLTSISSKTADTVNLIRQQKHNKICMVVSPNNKISPGVLHKISSHFNSIDLKLSERNSNLSVTPRSSKKCHTVQKPVDRCQKQDISLMAVNKIYVRPSSMKSPSSLKKSHVIIKTSPSDSPKTRKMSDLASHRRAMFSNSSIIKSKSSHLPTYSDNDNEAQHLKMQSALKMPFKTPSPGELKPLVKITPPLCSCGRRSKRRCVQSPGPNIGRWFFSCPISNSSFHGKSKGCTFFKWETLPSANKMPR